MTRKPFLTGAVSSALFFICGVTALPAKIRPGHFPTASASTKGVTQPVTQAPATYSMKLQPPGGSSTTLSLTASGNPVRYGAPVTLTATINPNTATGTVSFYSGGIPVGSSPVAGGIATFTTSLLSAGTDSLTAHYEGSSTYLGSSSPPLLETINDSSSVGFPSYTTVNVGTNPAPIPSWVSVGDFNGDGKQDLVSILGGTNQVAVSLGNGNGTFNSPFFFRTGPNPYALVVGDFNGDGRADLAVTSNDGIDILLGTGNGQFSGYISYSTPAANSGSSSFGLALGDFNGDGIPDLVVTDGLAVNGGGIGGLVSVFLGAGNGTFPTRTDYNVGQLPQAVTVGDFNNDGRADFAVADILDNTVYVYLGNGSGGFNLAPGSPVTTGNQPNDITTLKFGVSPYLSLVVANATDSDVQILTGNGTGAFTPQPGVPVGNQPDSLLVADFNGDLVPDIAVVNSSDNTVTILLNIQGELNSQGTYGGCVTCNYVSVAAGDFNNDGVTDLVVADQGQDNPPGGLNLLLGQGCSYSVFPTTIYQDDTSASPSVVLAGNGASCSWTAANTNTWFSLSSNGGSGTNGSVYVNISANSTGLDRTGTFTVAGQTITVTQRSTKGTYTDVTPAAYYFDAVNLFAAKNITTGCGPTTFCPTESVTRAQMAIFIVRAIYNGSDNFPYSQTPYFADVPVGSFGFQWIQHMYELGITTGCSSSPALIFCPDESVSRDQMAVFIVRSRFGASTVFTFPGTPYFTDVTPSTFGFEWIQRMKYDSITSGCSPTQYCPTEVVTRGDMAVFVMRGDFNDLLPAGTPVISAIGPAVLAHGGTAVFTITGINTSFVGGQTQLVFGTNSGIMVNTINVNSPTSMTVSLSASPGAAQVPNSIYVQTGTQEAVLPNGLTVQ